MSGLERLNTMLSRKRPPETAKPIGDLVEATARAAKRTQDRLGELVDLWERHVPASLASHTRLGSLRGGVLYVEVDSPATLYELDRLMRGGLETVIRGEFRSTLTRIRLKVAAVEETARQSSRSTGARKTSRSKR